MMVLAVIFSWINIEAYVKLNHIDVRSIQTQKIVKLKPLAGSLELNVPVEIRNVPV